MRSRDRHAFTRQGATLAYRWTDNVEQETATLRES